MKKYVILTLLLSAGALCPKAENALYIMPQSIEKGSTSEDGRCFAVCLDNDDVFTAIQFDIHLPEGVVFDTEYDPIEPVDERFPYTVDRKNNKIYKHTINYSYHSEGFYRVQITSQELATFNGTSGELITIYYVSDADIDSGVLPVSIDNVTMAISGSDGVYIQESPTFLWTSDFDPSTASTLDLSALKGEMCEGVRAGIEALIAEDRNLGELHLEGLDSISGDIITANPNCLKYAKDGSETSATLQGNVVSVSESGLYANEIALTDGEAFVCGTEVPCSSITYTRDFVTTDWQAFFVPFALSAEKWQEVGSVAMLESVEDDGTQASLKWSILTTEDLQPNTPYIIKPATVGKAEFKAESSLVPLDEEASKLQVQSDSRTFTLTGIYSTKSDMYSSDAYALANGNFKHASSDAVTLRPFRIFLEVSGNAKPAKVRNIVDGATSGINAIESDGASSETYDLLGRRISGHANGIIIHNRMKTIKRTKK